MVPAVTGQGCRVDQRRGPISQEQTHHNSSLPNLEMATIREPLHLFSIPHSVTSSLTLRQGPGYRATSDPLTTETPIEDPATSTSGPNVPSLTCATCSGATFVDVNEQRTHFRSDWHRYNVKIRLQDSNSKAVTEAEFGDLVEGKRISPHSPN